MYDEIKYCKFCDKEKPIKEFCRSGGFIKNICKECQNKKQKEIYANSKKVKEKDKEIERLHSIIKEVREYIEGEMSHHTSNGRLTRKELLEILRGDKE